jgi:hypothetical protein
MPEASNNGANISRRLKSIGRRSGYIRDVHVEPPASDDAASADTPRKALKRGLAETHRLEGLSDAAFSIIITLLVLEIHRPDAVRGKLSEELLGEWSSYIAYAVAFISCWPLKRHHSIAAW